LEQRGEPIKDARKGRLYMQWWREDSIILAPGALASPFERCDVMGKIARSAFFHHVTSFIYCAAQPRNHPTREGWMF
jgi:hypothetical protein